LTQHEEELKRRIEAARRKAAASKSPNRADSKRRRIAVSTVDKECDSDSEYIIGESGESRGTDEKDEAYLSPAVRALMEQLNPASSDTKKAKPFYTRKGGGEDEDEEPETTPKIIFASRTHTQLSQFISELKKTSFGKDMEEKASDGPVRNISLGSRKQMCINPSVQDLGKKVGMEAMNERCLELMKGSSAKSTKSRHCHFLPPSTEAGQARLLEYRDSAFTRVRDIEDLVELGREMEVCPYFGARSGARQAHLITLPYNLLLQANGRSSLNITLKDSIVIIDEAHNLIDTILSIHTVSITSKQVKQAREQIQEYLRRFSTRLKGSNEVNLKKLLKLLDSLDKECIAQQKRMKGAKTIEEIVTAAELVRRLGGNLDQINLLELEAWLKEMQIARKVAGYAEKKSPKLQDKVSSKDTKSQSQSALSAMHTIEAFLLSLANQSEDGRVLLSLSSENITEDSSLCLKYQLLNPADVFGEIAREARSVILAGGTMEPISDFTTQLFPKMDSTRLTHFSCNHVIPPENLMAAVVEKGPKGVNLEFKFDARGDVALLDDLTNCIANYCNVIPHGIVVFLPSYAFLDILVSRWKISQGLQRISAKKAIFYEPKLATQVDTVLRDYTLAATSSNSGSNGAILFAVVGAKLSEGINFSDRLARAVIMVGMPFANSASVELNERMKYVRSLNDKSRTIKDAGQELYINLCMKAVNQSIGRAIRHQSDYAALILLDRRYGRKDIRDRLPACEFVREPSVGLSELTLSSEQGIRPSVKTYDHFGPSMSALGAFFREKKAREAAS
jgi:chromosome transmission fidelity protein 1